MSILNYFQNLPFDIQEHIWKTYYSNNVLNEINNNFIDKRDYYYPVYDRWSLNTYRKIRSFYKKENILSKSQPSGQCKLHLEYDKMFEEFDKDEEDEYYQYEEDKLRRENFYGDYNYYFDEDNKLRREIFVTRGYN